MADEAVCAQEVTTIGRSRRRLPGSAKITSPVSYHAGPAVALADLVDEAAEICHGGAVFVASAWSSLEGAKLLWDLTDGRIAIEGVLVGVARRGTDRAALYAAMGVADAAYAYLDGNTQGQIAHFKIMRFNGPGKRIAIVGSGNLTRGGLLDNEEACVVLFDDGTAPRSVRQALDDVDRFLDDKVRSGYAHAIDEQLIARLVETGIVPVTHPRRRAAARVAAPAPTGGAVPPANTRRAYTYQRGAPPFVVPLFEGAVEPAEILVPEGTLPIPARVVVQRLVKFYGEGESNRIKKLNGQLPGKIGTHEFNVGMPAEAEREFWGYPALFRLTGKSVQRDISVRFRVRQRVEVVSGGAKPPRVFQRLREPDEGGPRTITEARFRPLSVSAMRALYKGVDVPPNALLVVERGTDVDFEARLVLPTDADYAALVPVGNLRQQRYTSG